MMTKPERSSISPGVLGGRCHAGSRSDNPCPRQATEYRWPDSGGPTLCPEHARVAFLADDADELRDALDQLQEWIQTVPSEHQALVNSVHDQRDELQRRYLEAVVKFSGARVIADGRKLSGEREYPNVSPEQAEDMALAFIRPDSFNNARGIHECLPEEAFGSHDRFVLSAVLEAAYREASEEYRRISRKIWPSDE
jgi:hypothetical protein